ncbi:Butyryl-CoA dehydrogenase [Altererythrobacter epoxidivorans]|uniref:Butyryl-CoA dehydrogenase n=1 Tax=Altererythrobacter epoxidivorans TaxID=361183 RepID=A0A0M4MTX5_9SPHN|nr:acyl-CoA dehydrogenase family protein [Altererythrobacter epoxidivorans]ALE15675.1 Butyryl-CoA dehydrogenase [Altererythrobacter epoxidivorans]
MDFTFTDEQQMLRDSVSAFLNRSYDFDARQKIVKGSEGWSRDVWSQLAELGLLALPVPEEAGGLGGGPVELVAIAEPFGAHLLAEPYAANALMVAPLLAAAEGNDMASDWLEKVVSGEALGALAYEEGHGTADPSHILTKAERRGEGFVINGEKRLVIGGRDADLLLVVALLDEQPAVFTVAPSADGVTLTDYATIDGRRAANIRFDAVELPGDALLLDNASQALQSMLDLAMLGLCAESVGAMGALMKQTAEYAMTRKQFGVPIATFQAVAHRLADMKIAYSKARATLLYIAALMEGGRETRRDMAILKGQTGKLGRMVGEAAIQTHGGVGMTDELSVGHLHKRILANDAMLGGSEYHLRVLGNLAAA